MNKLISKAWVLALGMCMFVQSAQSTSLRSALDCAYESLAEAHICTNDSFYFNQVWLRNEGSYNATFKDQNGCDSIVHLSLWHMPNSYQERIMHLCEGQSVDLGGHVISEPGTYQLHFKASWGCDSVVLIHVKGLPATKTTVNKTLCEGDSVFFGTKWVKESGTYKSSFARSGACDSVVTLNIEVAKTHTPIIKEIEGLYVALPADAYQWLTCPDYSAVPNATEARLNLSEEGDYSLRVENKGCIDTLDCTYFSKNTTGIENQNQVDVRVYPNPVSETLYVDGTFSGNIHVQVVNMLGQTVISTFVQAENILTIDMSGLIKGKYIVRISEENELIKKTIVVVH